MAITYEQFLIFVVLPFIGLIGVILGLLYSSLRKKEIVKIDLGRQTNFILAILLIYFVFFGYICNTYPKTADDLINLAIGERVVFLYQVLFNPYSILSLILLIGIVFLMAFREKFLEYGLRNSFWLSFIIIGISFIWYWFIVESFDLSIIGKFFTRYEGYLTILTLVGINMSVAALANLARRQYDKYKSY
ncbi:MAG: hypothetical protein ACFE9C_11820 [Candidatus Hodarchaeota archaeon]